MHNPSGAQCRGLAFGIIALGVCAAFLFSREPHSLSASPPSHPQEPIGVRSEEALTLQVVSSKPDAVAAEPVRESVPSSDLPPAPRLRSFPTLEGTPPPDLPTVYAPAIRAPSAAPLSPAKDNSTAVTQPTRRGTATAEPQFAAEATAKTDASTTAPAIAPLSYPAPAPAGASEVKTPTRGTASVPQTADPRPAQPLRHRVMDGDSLELLAERFLGDRMRWPDIFAANPGVLREPELLPIGVELVIPARAADDRPNPRHPGSGPATIRRLPPVTPELVPLSDGERALLQSPGAASGSSS